MSFQDDVGRKDVLGPAPTMNQYQLHSLRVIAQQRITQALEEFAQQLPEGVRYVQEAINGMGAVLDHLQMQTGQYLDPTQVDVSPPRYNQFAEQEEALRGVEESEEIKDINAAGG